MPKRVTIKNTPTIRETYSKNNYERANVKQLKKNMEKGKIVATIGKTIAYSQGRNVTPNNISELGEFTALNRKIIQNAYNKQKKNQTRKRVTALENAEFKQLMRNINNTRRFVNKN